jgi:hypothetical protein
MRFQRFAAEILHVAVFTQLLLQGEPRHALAGWRGNPPQGA